MKYVMTYESVPDFGRLAEPHFEAHIRRLRDFSKQDTLLMMGPLHEPSNGDALMIFSSQEAAEEFAADDPFVVNSLVKSYKIRPWQDGLPPEPAA